jgi:hypothetical protein
MKKTFIPDPDMCYFNKGALIERGHYVYAEDTTLEKRVEGLEYQFRELNSLLINIWGHYQSEMSPEMRESLDKIMKLCRDMAMEME